MRIVKMILVLGLMTCLSACAPVKSLNALFTEEEAIFEPNLLGKWVEYKDNSKEEKSMLLFESSNDKNTTAKAYSVIFKGEGEGLIPYKGRLGRLGTHLYLDLVPEMDNISANSITINISCLNGEARLEPNLAPISDMSYLRIVPAALNTSKPNLPGDFTLEVIPLHWFFRVTLGDNTLKLEGFDDEKIKDFIAAKNLGISHQREPELLLTATGEELRKFVEDIESDENVLEPMGKYSRLKQ
jgi:hypothetical protein